MMPSAFDEAGLRMLDSIREIFDILDFVFESLEFDLIKYNDFEELASAIGNDKCPVADVLRKHIDPTVENGSHVMVATGIQNENGIDYIQLKNSYADSTNEQGKVQKIMVNIYEVYKNFYQIFITCNITKS